MYIAPWLVGFLVFELYPLIFSFFYSFTDLNQRFKGINAFRTIYYLPSIMGGSVAVAILWRFIFSRDGVVNLMSARLGWQPVDWLGSPDWALYTISLLTVWQFGSSMVLFPAGLKG
ncbi:sugar ABC transporter permease [Paenibacillus sp. IB182496]|uniref:Sugar ABC transporter permease n=1 Tax=Paenibacillus sabuli TaxID=2772509 RepID=A0A927C018_9BACL|nr:sugar ABC transporter permease [Paenibacillus sabuli]MBD2848514.1 sugar ABC transporter permease [Paenibacillus sabuli]